MARDSAGGRGTNTALERVAYSLPRPSARSDARGACARLLRRRHAGSPASFTNFLSAPVLRLPADTERKYGREFRARRSLQDRIELWPGAIQVPIARDNLGRSARQPFWNPSVPHVLQGLHREGLGRPVRGDFRRMGRAAHQRFVGCEGHCARTRESVSQLVRRRSEEDGNQSDRAIPVSQIRTWSDVGRGCPAGNHTWGSDSLAATRGRCGTRSRQDRQRRCAR